MGGGAVVDPHPKGRHKRFSAQELAGLDTLAKGTPAEILLQSMLALGIAALQSVITRSNLDASSATNAIQELAANGDIILLENGEQATIPPQALITSKSYWLQLNRQILQEVEDYHKNYPLRRGIPREELKSRLKLSARLFNATLRLVLSEGSVEETGPFLRRVGFQHPIHPPTTAIRGWLIVPLCSFTILASNCQRMSG